MSMEHIDRLVAQWLSVDINEASRREISALQEAGRYDQLEAKLAKRIAFGTAGLRSSMEPGFAHMNDVTVLQASQGLVRYVVLNGGTSIVVGYDHRHHSQRFGELTATVALAAGLKVYYLGSVSALSAESAPGSVSEDRLYVHTPLVPFGIDHYGASAGVMVTASHNPAKDNGYKVYWGNGCQIIPPHDVGIAQSIEANLAPWLDKNVWDVAGHFERGVASGHLQPVKGPLTERYVDAVRERLVASTALTYDFVYTPMHGVGLEVFEKVAALFGVAVDVVPEQAAPDPDFPTVRFPNPEEAGALDLAIARAKARGMRLVMASDPDADRFSVAVESHGTWRQLTGNEIGILFAAFVVEELTPADELPQTYLVNSTVSSQLLRAMADKLGCHFQDTLTGFKWIGNRAIDLKRAGFRVPFGYEEAIGYMFAVVNDKDGISAAVMWMQLYQRWFAAGGDPVDKLADIYSRYGWFKECNGYYKLDDVAKTDEIFAAVRASYEGPHPVLLGDFAVVEWRDLTVGYESTTADHVPVLPVDAGSQMITGVLEKAGERVRFTCRGLGTEPKLKVYIEGRGDSEAGAAGIARACWDTLRREWFKPDVYGLQEVVPPQSQ